MTYWGVIVQDSANNDPLKREVIKDKLVTVASFKFSEEAYLARGKLQSEGIVSFVVDNYLPRMGANHIIELQVKESQVAEAERILNITRKKCPSCHSTEIGDNLSTSQKILFYVPFATLLPAFKKNLKLKCHACGYEWEKEEDET